MKYQESINDIVDYEDYESVTFSTPRNRFRNRFTYGVHETTRSFMFKASLLSLAVSCTFARLGYVPLWVSFVLIFGSAVCLLIAPKWNGIKFTRVTRKYKLEIAKVVLSVKPGFSIEKWDEVACLLNKIFHERAIWPTENMFFDGDACELKFSTEILRPFLKNGRGHLQDETSEVEKSVVKATCEYFMDNAAYCFDSQVEEELPEIDTEFQTLPKGNAADRLWRNKKYFRSIYFLFFAHEFLCTGLLMVNRPFVLLRFLLLSCYLGLVVRGYSHFGNAKYLKLRIGNKVTFLATVVKVSPMNDSKKWDLISRVMNQDLRANNGVWKESNEYFYDGEDCRKYFKRLLVKPIELESMVSAASIVSGF